MILDVVSCTKHFCTRTSETRFPLSDATTRCRMNFLLCLAKEAQKDVEPFPQGSSSMNLVRRKVQHQKFADVKDTKGLRGDLKGAAKHPV